jgi:putative membrane protein
MNAQKLSADDRQFIGNAAMGGMHEVHMGNLGLERGQSQAVKSFSQRIVTDHSKANQKLETLANRKGVTLPGDDAKTVTSMPIAAKNGAEFDREYARMMVEDHQKDIAAFEKEANSGSDPDVKAFAKETLPTLRAHLQAAETLPKD